MSMKEINKLVKGLDPKADAFAGTVYTDIWSMRNYGAAEVIRYDGVGTTGTSLITVEACDDVSASTTSAVPFKYQEIASGDIPGAITNATTAGFTTTAGSSKIIRIYVDASVLASSGYEFCRAKFVEVADAAVLGGVIVELKQPRSDAEVPVTAIV